MTSHSMEESVNGDGAALVPRRTPRAWLGTLDIPALGGEHVTALEIVSHLDGVAVAIDGRPAFAGDDERFEAARRVRLRRLRSRHVLEPADGPRPGRFRVVGVLGLDIDQAREALRDADPAGFAALPWVEARVVHRHLSRGARDILDQTRCLPHTDLSREVARDRHRRPVLTRRFAGALREIYETFLRDDCRLVLLEGAAGTGKSQLLVALASEILAGRVPARLQGSVVIKLGRAALESSSHPENEMVRDADLDAVTGSGSVIVAIDEAHRLLRGSSGRSEAMDLIKMMVTEQRQRLILCTNESSALKGIDEALDRRMTIVRLAQADRDEVLDEILPAKADLASERGIDRVAPAALELAYAVSRQIAVHAQPHASVALLDASLARAELRGDSALTAALVEEVASKALGGQRADANACAKAMRANIVGHDRALDALTRAYCAHQARLLDLDRNDDDGPFAFILQGPPGVGRRTTARALHRFRCGEGAGPACVIAGRDFDKDWSVTGILGAPPGYVGYGRQSPALRALKDIPRGVIIIEHPEDAHETFATRVVLPILRGALTLSDGHIVSTSGACVAVVTGAGADTAATRRAIGFTAEAIPATGARIDPIRRAMPEVLAAIGARRVFWLGPLGADDVRALVRMWLRSMDDTARLGVADHDRLIDAVIERAVAAGPGGGVRALRRAFDDLREALS